MTSCLIIHIAPRHLSSKLALAKLQPLVAFFSMLTEAPIGQTSAAKNDVEIGAENASYRDQHLSRYISPQTSTEQGLEAGVGTIETDALSYLGNCSLPNPDAIGMPPEGTEPVGKDDARPSGIRRRAPTSKTVSADDDQHAQRGARYAAEVLHRPLNAMLTLNLPAIRDAEPEDRHPLWKAERDRLRRFFTRNGEPFTYLMNRASLDKHGSGEHAHLLFHLDQPPLSGPVGKLVQGWSLH